MARDPAVEQREGDLVSNRIRELRVRPPIGGFDREHLQAVHGHLFQDLPHHRPGAIRADSDGWSKTRMLEGRPSVHEVHYAHENIAGRLDRILGELGGPNALKGLPPDAFASRLARLYGDLDHAHAFHEGNSRTLREFTRSLAAEAGYKLNWAPAGATVEQRNRLYIARDVAVLERAFPGLTLERGMKTENRAEYETSLALPYLRRVPGASLETIIREGLQPVSERAAQADTRVDPRSAADRIIAALAERQHAASPPSAPATSVAGREAHVVSSAAPSAPPSSAEPTNRTRPKYRRDSGPSP